ncbi:hypothetical protein FN846DRAFT_949316 [Sphaerosporella brunnea]|uniref:Uncharacterized protein n=1 Tax=Sphaerosporella brunnea TaxID=1250544 RepID=A0A5J5EWM1_9PEZI|nr:hypothetical protein FN846DRAFT_949316 [Sphaerosporella brunnea]
MSGIVAPPALWKGGVFFFSSLLFSSVFLSRYCETRRCRPLLYVNAVLFPNHPIIRARHSHSSGGKPHTPMHARLRATASK